MPSSGGLRGHLSSGRMLTTDLMRRKQVLMKRAGLAQFH